jgi:hypothetical protein
MDPFSGFKKNRHRISRETNYVEIQLLKEKKIVI